MAGREEKQLQSLKKWIEKWAPDIDSQLSVRLWNGDILPLGPNAKEDILFAINSPEAVRRLIFSPRLMTLFELYAENLIDIEGGTPLEASYRWDHITILEYAKRLDKIDLIKSLWPFVTLSSGGGDKKGLSYDERISRRIEDGRNDMDLISFHYDLSNEFYSLFLDPDMVYSCAYFATEEEPLESAQRAKLDLICKKLDLSPGEKLLDIGCGWGGLIIYAAANYGVRAHGVTLSRRQYDFVTRRVEEEGLSELVKVELKDYREIDMDGGYDKIVQIEMFEHLGIDNHDAHFEYIHSLLKPRGLYLHQASTRRATRDISSFRKETPYQKVITRFIFPGGELDHIGMTLTNLERFGFEVHDVEGMREHFKLTLERWIERLWEKREEAANEIGWPKTRLWLLYLSLFCIAFDRGTVNVFQTLASRREVGSSKLPLRRERMIPRP